MVQSVTLRSSMGEFVGLAFRGVEAGTYYARISSGDLFSRPKDPGFTKSEQEFQQMQPRRQN